jgi:hypothetical protein
MIQKDSNIFSEWKDFLIRVVIRHKEAIDLLEIVMRDEEESIDLLSAGIFWNSRSTVSLIFLIHG